MKWIIFGWKFPSTAEYEFQMSVSIGIHNYIQWQSDGENVTQQSSWQIDGMVSTPTAAGPLMSANWRRNSTRAHFIPIQRIVLLWRVENERNAENSLEAWEFICLCAVWALIPHCPRFLLSDINYNTASSGRENFCFCVESEQLGLCESNSNAEVRLNGNTNKCGSKILR